MRNPLRIDIITIFPSMLKGFLDESILKRAQKQAAVKFNVINLRDFTTDRHKTVDDQPFGGGPGMVMKPEPLFKAVESVRLPTAKVILMTPQGKSFNQAMARKLTRAAQLIFICGHYEGIDERVNEGLATDEISIGDYILTNGTLAATVVIDAVVRLLPNVLGGAGATESESFEQNLLEYPQYTRPREFRKMKVPDILLSGDHGAIERWRTQQARRRTAERRPDLLNPEAGKNRP